MSSRVHGFLRFWYEFVVGDDWRIALGVVLALGLTLVVSRAGLPAWWLMPLAVVILLPASVWRAVRAARGPRKG